MLNNQTALADPKIITSKEIEMNKQQIYDKVIHHMRKQGRASTLGVHCAYRGGAGHRCAIGAIIPDDLYQPWFEGKNASTMIAGEPNLWPHFTLEAAPTVSEEAFLDDLQDDLHDTLIYSPEGEFLLNLEYRAAKFCKHWGLKYTGVGAQAA